MSPPGVLQSDTKAAVLSAEGRGAIALVRVWGADASRSLTPHSARCGGASWPRPHRAGSAWDASVRGWGMRSWPWCCQGRFRRSRSSATAGRRRSRWSSTHSTPRVLNRSPPRNGWSGRARSAITAKAAIDLPRAPTVRTAAILLAQAEGALEEELGRIARALPQDVPDALARLDALLERWPVGARLIAGWRVVLAGRPNVGKSHLLNALAGYERAIVDPTPGTTRDVVTVATAFDGWPVELADTAGLRTSLDPIESQGVSLARSRHRAADLVLLVLDRSEPLTEDDRALLAEWPRALRIANKADLPVSWCAAEQGALEVSATRGDGIEPLVATIARRLVPDPPGEGVGVPFRAEQAQALRQVRALLAEGAIDAALHALERLL